MSTSAKTQKWLLEAKSDLLCVLRGYDRSTCIFSAPKELLKEYEDAYVPRIVSIGPYHFGKEELREMERFKGEAVRRELVRIQSRPGNSNFSFDNLLSKVDTMVGRICRCYNKEMPYNIMEIHDNHHVLCWMIARDACFILEFLRCYVYQVEGVDWLMENGEILQFHPIFGLISENPVVKSEIMKDLIKLENQIPLFVLEEILAMEMGGSIESAKSKLQNLLKAVFHKIYYRPFGYCADGQSPRQNHILDIYYYCCLGNEELQGDQHRDNNELEGERQGSKFPSAVKLQNGGVKIQAAGEKVEHVNFEGRTLSIPAIQINVDSEVYIRNLIALEICSPCGPLKRMAAFSQFMNELCQTEKGAAVMKENGVIVGNLWQHSEIARFFSSCKQSPSIPSQYPIVVTRRKLIRYYNRNCWIATAKVWNEFWSAYFSKPWLLIGGFGASIILILTAVQVFCLFHSCGARGITG